jgi:hypothetical protein
MKSLLSFTKLFFLGEMILLSMLLPAAVWAQTTAWQAGDVILMRTNGRTAQAISQTVAQAPYSHVGILWPQHGQMMVLEVWQKIQKVSLEDFLARQASDAPLAVYRPRELDDLALQDPELFKKLTRRLHQDFLELENRPYDDLYGLGQAFYCSNFVQYLLNGILQQKIPSHPMQFKAKFWRDYFAEKGLREIPRELPGIAPGDFARSPLFKEIYVRLPVKKSVAAIIRPATTPINICAGIFLPHPTKI